MKYFKEQKLEKLDFERFKKITPKEFKEAKFLAKKLQGIKILNINSTSLGGGVAEILKSQLPLENSLKINSFWYVLKAPTEFFKITKKIHNFLQGEKGSLKESEKNFYLEFLFKKAAPDFKKLVLKIKPHILIIHDPQPLPLINFVPPSIKTILRIHIDLSEPNKEVAFFLKPFIEKYQKVIFSHKDYRFNLLPQKKVKIIFPAIDPFSEKNRFLKVSQAKEILAFLGIHPEKPILLQVARFDPWKDHFSTLKAYYLAKNHFPKLQLVLVGIPQPKDDPQAQEIFEKVKKHAKGDPDVYLFSDIKQIKTISPDLFINALNTTSTVFMHKSIKEGFGLAITEAMWKKKPVIGGKTKGIELQITHKKNGFLVENAEEAAFWIEKLLKDKNLRKKIGKRAYETVKSKFLISRLVLDHLKLYQELLKS